MATTAAPYGARPVGTLSASGSFTGKVNHYRIADDYSTLISEGDFVKLAVTGYVQKDTGTDALTPIGIFVGCAYTDDATGQFTVNNHWPASTSSADAVAYVVDDPQVVFQMQGDGTIPLNYLCGNFEVEVTAGSASVGRSKNAVDASTVATTNTLPLKVVGFVDGPTSAVGDAYTDVKCIFNVGHQLTNTTGLATS